MKGKDSDKPFYFMLICECVFNVIHLIDPEFEAYVLITCVLCCVCLRHDISVQLLFTEFTAV